MIYEYLSKVSIAQDYLFHNTEHNCVLLNFMTRFLIMPETNWLIDRENKFDSRKNVTNGAAEQKIINFLIDKVQGFEDLQNESDLQSTNYILNGLLPMTYKYVKTISTLTNNNHKNS